MTRSALAFGPLTGGPPLSLISILHNERFHLRAMDSRRGVFADTGPGDVEVRRRSRREPFSIRTTPTTSVTAYRLGDSAAASCWLCRQARTAVAGTTSLPIPNFFGLTPSAKPIN